MGSDIVNHQSSIHHEEDAHGGGSGEPEISLGG